MKLIQKLEIIHWLKSQPKNYLLTLGLSILWLCLLAWLAFFCNLGNIGLIDETEPLFAEAARQMLETGDWVTPYFNGETRFDKPPLIYWLMAIAYHIVGVNEWAVRLPSAISATTLMCFGFYTLYRYGHHNLSDQISTSNKKSLMIQLLIAWIGGAMIALNPETIAWGRIGVSDMLLTGCMCSALLAFFMGYASQSTNNYISKLNQIQPQKNNRIPQPKNLLSATKNNTSTFKKSTKFNHWYFAFYILIALAILAKGPIGIILPILIITSFLLYVGRFFQVWQEIKILRGSLIILTITLPWYILITLSHGQDYINTFFGYHNFERFTRVVNHHGAPWYFYFLVVLIGFAPWSIYLPLGMAKTKFWQRNYWQRQPRNQQLGLFAFFWFICIFIFFSVAVTKLPSYVLPLMPAAAILVGIFWSEIIVNGALVPKKSVIRSSEVATQSISTIGGKFLYFSIILNIIFLLILAVAIIFSFNWLGRDPAMPHFPELIKNSGLLIRGGIIWIATTIVIGFMFRKKHISWIWSANFIGLIACLIFTINPMMFLVDQERQLPLRQLAEKIIQVKQPGEEIIMISFEKPSLVFYTQEPVAFFRRATNAREYLEKLVKKDPLGNVIIIGYPKKFIHAGLEPGKYQYLDSRGAYQLGKVPKHLFLAR